MNRLALVLVIALPWLGAACSKPVPSSTTTEKSPPGAKSYLERRAGFQTRLLRSGPAPQKGQPIPAIENVEEVQYPSGNLKLKAWVYVPPKPKDGKHPALVYFHGGFALGTGDLTDCFRSVPRDMVILWPTVRGENGNAGNFELFLGEVDDAKAAVKWLAQQPYVDPNRIYAFGHSAGGGITALLSLLDDVPLRHSGSSGGLYEEGTFDAWPFVPFDRDKPEERKLRILVGNIRHMRQRHLAYLGEVDSFDDSIALARKEMGDSPALLEIIKLPGDHFTSLKPALEAYVKRIQEDK